MAVLLRATCARVPPAAQPPSSSFPVVDAFGAREISPPLRKTPAVFASHARATRAFSTQQRHLAARYEVADHLH
jgi:hypothetical protein